MLVRNPPDTEKESKVPACPSRTLVVTVDTILIILVLKTRCEHDVASKTQLHLQHPTEHGLQPILRRLLPLLLYLRLAAGHLKSLHGL